jgi:hypothetical protein
MTIISTKHLALLAAIATNAVGCGVYETNMAAQPVTPDAIVEPPSGSDSVVIGASTNATVYEDTDPSALADFREPLSPYGVWVDDGTYGTVWVPNETVVGADFQPYVSGGHWAYDDDYVWVSDYSWGWAPFHYGRWVYIAGRGWSWIPGRTYSGAWVTWRTGPSGYGYVGWAPMQPSWYWYNGYAVGLGVMPPAPYVFCHTDHMFHSDVRGRVVRDPAQIQQIGGATRPYIPASPSVNGRVAASPTVNGRVAASPTVNTRVAASPSVVGSERGYVAAGPSPSALGIANPPSAPREHAGLTQARSFAAPATTPVVVQRARAEGYTGGVATAPRFQGVEPRRVESPRGSTTVAQQPSQWTRPMELPRGADPRVIQAPPRDVPIQAMPSQQPSVFSRPSSESSFSRPAEVARPSAPPVFSRPSTESFARPSAPVSRPQSFEAARPSTPSFSRPSSGSSFGGGSSQTFSRPSTPSVSPMSRPSTSFRRR